MTEIFSFGTIKDGRLEITNRVKFILELKTFEGKKVEVVIRDKSKRSVQQNRLFWLYCGIIGSELGYEKEEMAAILKFKFLKVEKIDERTGEIFQYIQGTSELNKEDFVIFTNRIIQWSAEMGIKLPLPDEQQEIGYKQ